jgi:hypothetical protein
MCLYSDGMRKKKKKKKKNRGRREREMYIGFWLDLNPTKFVN